MIDDFGVRLVSSLTDHYLAKLRMGSKKKYFFFIKQAPFKQRSHSNTFDISVHATRWKIKPHSFNINGILRLIAFAPLMNLEEKVLKRHSAVTSDATVLSLNL